MEWTHNLAYAVGLIASDGCLSNDGRHILFVTKDREQANNFHRILNLNVKIARKKSGYTGKKDAYLVQFSHVKLYRFLVSIGLFPNKSLALGALVVPDKFFADFLRGCLDGDGFTYSYFDKRWKSSFRMYLGITSASFIFLMWLEEQVFRLFNIRGRIKDCGRSAFQLVFAKNSTLALLKKLYYDADVVCLSRKKSKIDAALQQIAELNQPSLA